jgi:hypothetical protein
MEIDFSRQGERAWMGRGYAILGPAEPMAFTFWNESRRQSGRAVEIAFDYENGYIVMETNLAAKICRAAEDIVHEAFCGQ